VSSNPRADNFFLDALVCPEGAADVLAEEVASLFIKHHSLPFHLAIIMHKL
jgi:hypothetical protein